MKTLNVTVNLEVEVSSPRDREAVRLDIYNKLEELMQEESLEYDIDTDSLDEEEDF